MTFQHAKLLHKDTWKNHHVEIRDEGDFRSLYFDSGYLQSRMSLTRPEDLVLSYTEIMAFTILLQSAPGRILIIGLGSGSFVRFFHHHFPDCILDCVDNSQHVINMARGYFQLPENGQVRIFCMDGQDFLQDSQQQYDLILVDAFDSQGMAPSIYTDSFFRLAKKCVKPEGILSCNLWSGDKKLLTELKKTIKSHLPQILYLPVPNRGNLVALAMAQAIPWDKTKLKKKKLRKLSEKYNLNFKQMIQIAKQNNLTFASRLKRLLE